MFDVFRKPVVADSEWRQNPDEHKYHSGVDPIPTTKEQGLVDVGDYPLPEQPTAEELREVSQIRNLIGYARYVSLKYGSHWVHIRFSPNQRQIAYLKSKGYELYRKEQLEENGVASHKRSYTWSLNWSGVPPQDSNLIEQ